MKLDLKELLAKITGQTEFKTLLWTNPNPSSAFSAQTISLDLSNYDEIELFYMGSSNSSNTTVNSTKFIVGKGGLLNMSANEIWWRYITPRSTGVEFDTGYRTQTYGSSASADNSFIVPYKIYGIRYVGGGST